MKRVLLILAALALILALYVGAFMAANHSVAGAPSDVRRVARADLPIAGETLDLLTWNLGYGGLGAGSDFIADGGKNALPPSRRAVQENVAGIEALLRTRSSFSDWLCSDRLMLSESTKPPRSEARS